MSKVAEALYPYDMLSARDRSIPGRASSHKDKDEFMKGIRICIRFQSYESFNTSARARWLFDVRES